MTDADHAVALDADLEDRLCRLLVGWDTLEQRNGAKPVIDFNLPGIVEGDHFEHRLEVLDAVVELQRSCAPDSFARQRLTAHEMYLRALMGQRLCASSARTPTQRRPARSPPSLPTRRRW